MAESAHRDCAPQRSLSSRGVVSAVSDAVKHAPKDASYAEILKSLSWLRGTEWGRG